MKEFTINVPATSANLGPGYDVIGMALKVYNRFDVAVTNDDKIRITIEGEGRGELPLDKTNLFIKAVKRGLDHVGLPLPGISVKLTNCIPLTRGMGSSASATLAGLMAAQKISEGRLSDNAVISIAVEIEGHPDNLMAALTGGIVINYEKDGEYRGVKFMPSGPLSAVLAIPNVVVETQKARKILPKAYAVEDVVTSVRSMAILIHSLKSGEYQLLKEAMNDRIHQPYRGRLIPGFKNVENAAMQAGALFFAISGSGSTVIALCDGNEKITADGMKKAFEAEEVECRTVITEISEKGACFIG